MKIKIFVAAFLFFCLHNTTECAYRPDDTPIAQLLLQQGTLSFRSCEGKVVFMPVHLLSTECMERLKRLDSQMIDGKIINTNYCSGALSLAATILTYQAGLKLVKAGTTNLYPVDKVTTYLNSSTDGMLSRAQQLCKALVFFGVTGPCFDAVKKQLQNALNCDAKELLYTYQDFYSDLQIENIKSVVDGQPPDMSETASFARQELNSKLFLSNRQRRQLAFDLALRYAKHDPNVAPDYILDVQTWQDLEVMCGPESHPECSLVAEIDCTSTELGKVMLSAELLQPTCDISKLGKKQQIIRMLLDNPAVFNELDQLFSDFFENQKLENNILAFWAGSDHFAAMLKYPEFSGEKFQKISKWLSTHEIYTQVNEGGDGLSFIICDKVCKAKRKVIDICLAAVKDYPQARGYLTDMGLLLPTIIKTITSVGGYVSETDYHSSCKTALKGLVVAALGTLLISGNIPAVGLAVITGYVADKFLSMGMQVADSLMTSDGEGIRAMAELNFCMHERLVLLARYIKFMQQVTLCIDRLPGFKALLPTLNALNIQEQPSSLFSYFGNEFTGPASFDQFINKLFSVGDNNDAWQKYYFGRVIATYRLVELHKDSLFPSIMALAHLDMYLSFARLYKRHETCNNRISFADFSDINQTGSPMMQLINFWNPRVGVNSVANTLMLGVEGEPQTAVITGPNGEGKSTALSGFLSAIVIALSTSMIPAEYGKITPFSAIRFYSNITDNAAQGLSLFQSSVKRATDLIHKAQDHNGCSLIVFDELYNGTKPECGESLAYATLSDLGSSDDYQRTLCIATTHFPCLEQLVEDPDARIAYYRVAGKDDISNRYKLLPGIYTGFNAFETAQAFGMVPNVLDIAQHYYKQKFGDNLMLTMLLDMVEDNGNALEDFIGKQAYRKVFIDLILTQSHSARFFDIMQKHGTDLATVLNLTDKSGKSILHYAAMRDSKDTVLLQKLTNNGADYMLQDAAGKRPIEYAFKGSVVQKFLHNLISTTNR